jgi:hypothetical protein
MCVFSVQIRETHTTEVNQGQKSSIPARAANDGYSPFKVDIKQNKVEWALARWEGLPFNPFIFDPVLNIVYYCMRT